MLFGMNATAQASAAPITGPKLDNRRVLAAVLDLAIVVAGSLVILFAADALSGDNSDVRGALSAVILGWALYYHFALESGEGQTVGKKLMKLRVVRADGRPAGMREIAVRTVLRVVDGIGGYIVGLIVMLATGQRRQRLGDLAAGTIVVDASAPAYVPPAPVEAPPVEEEAVDSEVEMNSLEDTPTITLPSRPAPATIDDLSAPEAPPVPEMRPFDPPAAEQEPAAEVVGDEPAAAEPIALEEQVAVEEPVAEEPVAVEPVVVEPVVVEEPVVEEPVVEELLVDEPVAEVAVVDVPAVEVAERAEDAEPIEDAPEPVAEEPLPEVSTPSLDELAQDVEAARAEPVPVVPQDADESDEDEPMTVKSVETVSAIDLVMGGAPEQDASSEQDQDPEGPAAS
jgi:uncharacterized RDD family membrane protein YckC